MSSGRMYCRSPFDALSFSERCLFFQGQLEMP